MELIVIVALVIGVAWFAVPRLASRRRAEDDAYANGGMGMLSWLPAWMLFGAMTTPHDGDHSSDAGSSGHGDHSDWGGGGFGGGGDSGGGGGDSGGGGGDMGGGGFSGN